MQNHNATKSKLASTVRSIAFLCSMVFAGNGSAQNWTDVTTGDGSTVVPRHEAGYVAYNNKLYLFGGRGQRPVSVYDAATGLWTTLPAPPIELHHFQPVVVNNKIYILGGFTCCYPVETIVEDIYTFDPATGIWEVVGTMPSNRARGSTAAIVRNNKIYLLGGNTLGHSGGAVAWFDEYDPSTNTWQVLADAPTQRDHFSAALVGNRLVAAAGRQTNVSFANLVSTTDVYNFGNGQWTTTDPIPTPRAGAVIAEHDNNIYVMGGETDTTSLALRTVEAYDVNSGKWRTFTDMLNGRHSGGAGILNNELHVASGNLSRGGSYETELHESVDMSDSDGDGLLDTEEVFVHNTDPAKSDTDNDGVSDWQEVRNNSTGNQNSNVDSDGDGLTNQEEISTYGTNPSRSDTDSDGLNDKAEIDQHQTNPLQADSDNDGVDDGIEIAAQLDPLNPDTDGDNLSDGAEINNHLTDAGKADTDDDGLNDDVEINNQLDPKNPDTDGDNLNDGSEINTHNTDPLVTDTDNDGLLDGDEVNSYSTNPLSSDSDGDTLSDPNELQVYFTNPVQADSDADGIDDNAELQVHSSDPNNPDSDGDGISDGVELDNGSSLTDLDEDKDGILNSAEGNGDPDGDGLPNFMDLDSDNDGITDTLENTVLTIEPAPETDDETTTEPVTAANTPATATLVDSDLDGVPDFLDLDSDQDGITDKEEVGLQDNNSTGRISAENFVDEDNNGWADSFTSENLPLRDTDGDQIPDYLDHDSDNDGKTDATEAGGIDVDEDGVLDSAIDSNSDGLDDELLGAARPTADEDGDDIPDYLDDIFSTNIFGCSMTADNGPKDPLFIAMLLLLFASRYRSQRISAGTK